MPDFELFASYFTHPGHHELFRSNELVTRWARTYPMLFDEDDLRIAQTQAEGGYHFYEWLAAVLIYHTHGLYSLVEQYQLGRHSSKQEKLAKLTTAEVVEFIRSHPEFGKVQCPDLIVYQPDYSDWFFCEVKGPTDRVRDVQVEFFRALSNLSGKPVRLLKFRDLAWK
jgi:hypothetical protein